MLIFLMVIKLMQLMVLLLLLLLLMMMLLLVLSIVVCLLLLLLLLSSPNLCVATCCRFGQLPHAACARIVGIVWLVSIVFSIGSLCLSSS